MKLGAVWSWVVRGWGVFGKGWGWNSVILLYYRIKQVNTLVFMIVIDITTLKLLQALRSIYSRLAFVRTFRVKYMPRVAHSKCFGADLGDRIGSLGSGITVTVVCIAEVPEAF